MLKHEKVIAGNFYNKYGTKNFIEKRMMKSFFDAVKDILRDLKPLKILEVGAGEGFMAQLVYEFYSEKADVFGIDISANIIEQAQKKYPDIKFSAQSIYDLDFDAKSFDLVVAFEVLEHLDDPERAIAEIKRVGKSDFIFSVPREPFWRFLNLFRLKYVRRLGNTPGHIQHWSGTGFIKMLSAFMTPVKVKKPPPFIMAYCRRDL